MKAVRERCFSRVLEEICCSAGDFACRMCAGERLICDYNLDGMPVRSALAEALLLRSETARFLIPRTSRLFSHIVRLLFLCRRLLRDVFLILRAVRLARLFLRA